MTRDLKTNQHNLRMLTVAFSRTDLHLPAMAAVIPKNQSLSQVVPVLPTYKVNKSPSCRTLPALCCGLGTADKHEGALDFQSECACPGLMVHAATTSWESAHARCPGSGVTTSVLLSACEAAARSKKRHRSS